MQLTEEKRIELGKRLLALTREQELDLEKIRKHEHNNAIYFFGIKDEKGRERHKDCCNLFKGANPKQAELLKAWADPSYKTFTLTGSNKFGKTTAGTIIAISCMIGYWPWDKMKVKISKVPVKIRYIGQDWENHVKTVLAPCLWKWWPKERKVINKKNNQGVDAFWEDVATKSTLEIMSNKQEVDVFEGWDGDIVIYDEPPRREIRIACARGLAVTNGRELFTATLLKEPWVDREVIKARLEDGRPDPSVFNVHGVIEDNLDFGMTQEGIDNFAKKLTADEKSARLKGVPSYMSGLNYPQFKRETHLKKRYKVPLDYIVDIAIDTHPAKEQAVLFMATDPRNYKYLIDEIWMYGDGTAIGEEIIRYITRNAYRCNKFLIDSSAKGNQNEPFTTYERIDNVLFKYGYALETYKKDETGGIQATRNLLISPNNEPALFIFDDLVRTIFEIEGYMIDPVTFKPQDKENDMMDNLYALANENTQWFPPLPKKSKETASNWKTV